MNKRTPNFIALRELRDQMRILELQDIEDNPDLYLFMRFVELFQEFDLPVEHVGKLRVDVNNDFFENKRFASQIMVAVVQHCKNVHDLILERVKDKEVAAQIFGDWMDNKTGIYWYGVQTNIDPELDCDS